jgi:hypothetical protein
VVSGVEVPRRRRVGRATWTTLRDDIDPRRWGGDWLVDEELPDAVLGGRSIWAHLRFIAIDCPNVRYTVAQFAHDPIIGTDAVYGIDAELASRADGRHPPTCRGAV